jgi:hypothetical protein
MEFQGTHKGITFEATVDYEAPMTYGALEDCHPGSLDYEITSAYVEDEEDFSMYDNGINNNEKSLMEFLSTQHDEIMEIISDDM